jgi:hypothetical protein
VILEYDHITELLKAASKRMDDALELLESPSRERNRSDATFRHLCGAQYLAGYAVECALKSYIIYQMSIRGAERVQRWSKVLDARQTAGAKPDLSGSRSHSLPLLLAVADLETIIASDADLRRAWGACSRWTPALRYKPTPLTNRRETTEMVESCRKIERWLRTRLRT